DITDLELNGFSAETVAGAQPVLWLNDAINVLIRGSRMANGQRFLRVSGARSKGVKLIGNDLTGAAQAIEYGPGVARSVVQPVGNALASPAGS
ncbi:MAG: glycoside hydrolase family 28 protein, partial [Acidobacteria bacterium]|nr:glycoside hydrolase family 28 protein [Acidobacteriota bacterium]